MADTSPTVLSTAASSGQVVREALVLNLRVGDAHQTFGDAISDFPIDAINVRPPNVKYSFWHLVEHVRFCQAEMLDYLENPGYRAVTFPDDYWPEPTTEASEQQWYDTIAAYNQDVDRIVSFIMNEALDIYTVAPHAWEPHHTPVHTLLVMADHAAYHGGEFGILRQVMGLWAPERLDHFTIAAAVTQNADPKKGAN
jgi:DinB superfamily